MSAAEDSAVHEPKRDDPRRHAEARGRLAAASPLLERGAELAEIDALVNDARDGAGRLVLIEGPPGIGKTRLLAETREHAGELGSDVAARYLRRALAEPPPAESRAEVLFELGSAGVRVGEPDAVALLAEAFELAAEPELRGRIALELSGQALDAGRTTEAAKVLAEALEGLGGRSPELELRLESLLLALGVTTVGARHVARGRFAVARERSRATRRGHLARHRLPRPAPGGADRAARLRTGRLTGPAWAP